MKRVIAIVRAELWQRRWAMVWWSLGISAFIVINLAVYPSFKEQAAELNNALANLPDAVKDLFSDNGDFASPSGYLSSQIYYLLLPMLFTILAINLGSSLLARDERAGTLELLLARPVSRTTILLSKAVAGGIVLAVVGAATLVVALAGCRMAGIEIPLQGVIVTTLVSLALATFFGTISFALTALGRNARLASIGLASLVALASYLVSSLSQTVHWLEWPAKLSPYTYYHTSAILTTASSGRKLALALLVAIIILLVGAWFGFRRRDVEAR